MIEVKPLSIQATPIKQNCFGGAWYHKVMSITYPFYGIEGVITLPIPFIKRYADSKKYKGILNLNSKNLDVSSIYLGGHATDESDVGLALFRAQLFNRISTGACVYRPFWRYITNEFEDIGGYDLEHQRFYASTMLSNHDGMKNIYAQHHPSFTEFYYLPGDTIKMSLSSPKPHFMQLTIEVIEISTLPYAVQMRRRNRWKAPQTFYSPLFFSKGHGTDMPKTYKRVNAIDQVKNEGRQAAMTDSEILNAQWKSCFLYYKANGTLFKTPFNNYVGVTMQCPDDKAFIVTGIDNVTGGQMISICPKEVLK
jgi:hypothetical protein